MFVTGAMLFTVFTIVSLVAVLSFVAILSWVGVRHREREALYRSEVLKKIADRPEGAAQDMLEIMRQDERNAQIRKREGLKLGGLIVTAVGVGLMVLLAVLDRAEPAWVVGLIPLLIGVALLAYVYVLAPRING